MDAHLDRAKLLALTRVEFEFLERSLGGLTPVELCAVGTRGWSAKDHLAHVDAWHRRLLSWLEQHRAGLEPAMPEAGYTWQQLDKLNVEDRARRRELPLDDVLASLRESYQLVLELIESLTDEELFEPGRLAWFRGPLCQLVAHNAHLHYPDHAKRIRESRGATDWWHGK